MDSERRATKELPFTKLHVSSSHETRTIALRSGDSLRIGRDSSNDLCDSDPALSRMHAVVFHVKDGVWLRDRDSVNGTFLNNTRIEKCERLEHGDSVIVASIRITVEVVASCMSSANITHWIIQARSEDQDERNIASQCLWQRYFAEVRSIVRRRPVFFSHIENDEDIAIQALTIMFHGLSNGRFREINSRQGFWNVLRTVTLREMYRAGRKYSALKRNGQTVSLDQVPCEQSLCDRAQVSPAARLDIEELLQRITRELREVVVLKAEGRTNKEIAKRLSVSERTVERHLRRVREIFAASLK